MASTLTQSALFVAGIVLGASTAIVYKNKQTDSSSTSSSSTTNPNSDSSNQPIFTRQFHSEFKSQAPNQILKFGNPGPINDFFSRQAYAMGYDRRMRNPSWTAEHLTSSNIRPPRSPGGDQPDRSHSNFHEDPALPPEFRAKLSDYFRSGYDRGHMVPAADAKISQEAMNETFILSNIAPQVGEGFNRDYWAHLENFVRQLTTSFSDVYVFTIPLYLPKQDPITQKQIVSYEVIGNPPNVAVPTHFAKIVYGVNGHQGSLGSFVLPNTKISNQIPLRSFETPVDSVEKASGLKLFPDQIKSNSSKLCETVKCEMVIRNFDQARKQVTGNKNIGP
ncbi:uncharacterized protein MELLADRAFT_78192 [Melampsora larici-populina 98AG31]|uniref:Endonuclease n=1 Tax=Melampsora larici-populina (strain 98AG31 / pathotype 3-4-7) TaxID=747676 RepID=F4RRA1_MELLP|nr:uncharacterized protein MELLADRAFT_78192 [Melampsora larici-populina 98AG31]EGG05186.1 hypothetical protein MELLADRAFT_78192 [Melampsora larici-populina 98AG31]